MPQKKEHSEMQAVVCCVCFTKPPKAKQNTTNKGDLRNISDKLAILIKAKVLTDYGEVVDGKFQINKKWEWLPTVVCNSCRTRLQKDNSEVYFAGLTRQSYTEMTPPRPMTRATYGVCLCSVCLVGRENAAGSLHVTSRNPIGRPSTSSSEGAQSPYPVVKCSDCSGIIARGVDHPCTARARKENLIEMITQASPKTKRQVLAHTLKGVFDEEGQSTRGGSVSLATGGRPILATLGKQKYAPSPFFSNEALNNLQKRLNCSDRKLLILANFLRVYAGKVSVEPHTQDFLIERNNIFRTFFLPQNGHNVRILHSRGCCQGSQTEETN